MNDVRFEAKQTNAPAAIPADVLVLPVRAEDLGSAWLKAFDRATGGGLAAHVKQVGYEAKAGSVLQHRLAEDAKAGIAVLVGLGGDRETDPWRRAGGAACRVAKTARAKHVAAWASGAAVERLAELGEGFALAGYRFDRYRSGARKPSRVRFTAVAPKLAGTKLRDQLKAVGDVLPGVFGARDFVNEPPSKKNATAFAREGAKLCRASGVEVEILTEAKIRSAKMEGLLAVNRGSTEPPRFVKLRYKPKGRAKLRVGLVGKGITFDSGGLSLKPPKAMETMKCDMAGAAAVFGALAAIGKLKPSVEVRGYVAATDNLPSGSAQKPGDVITYRNGRTVEVLNTDAEGRLVLADALIEASRDKCDVIVDLATLTGACMVALGTNVAGLMGNDDALCDALLAASRETGEPLWRLPLVADYRKDLDGSISDLKNIGGLFGGTITAGLFLQEFVEGADWAHLDIAGPSFSERDLPIGPRGGTGFGVRTLVRWIESL